MANYEKISMADLPPIECPCGTTRRAFADGEDKTASVHLLQVFDEARTHYHKTFTEHYYIIEGEGFIEIDGEDIPVKPEDVIKIMPYARHKAKGFFKILNIAVPVFDPNDEHED